MVCIGTSKELYKARELPEAVRADIAEMVNILDTCFELLKKTNNW